MDRLTVNFFPLVQVFLRTDSVPLSVMHLCDGHGSHYTPNGITRAVAEGVTIFCIPPNTSHKVQLLDISFFASLKCHWSSTCYSFMVNNPGSVVTRLKFSRLFSKARMIIAIKPDTLLMVSGRQGYAHWIKMRLKLLVSQLWGHNQHVIYISMIFLPILLY